MPEGETVEYPFSGDENDRSAFQISEDPMIGDYLVNTPKHVQPEEEETVIVDGKKYLLDDFLEDYFEERREEDTTRHMNDYSNILHYTPEIPEVA